MIPNGIISVFTGLVLLVKLICKSFSEQEEKQINKIQSVDSNRWCRRGPWQWSDTFSEYCSASSDPRLRVLFIILYIEVEPCSGQWRGCERAWKGAILQEEINNHTTEAGVLTASTTLCCNTNIASCFWRLQCRCWPYLTCPSTGYHPASAGSHLFSTWNKCRVVWPQLLAFISSAPGRKAR